MPDYASFSSLEIERHARRVQPGEWAIDHERPIATLLGSCVAVCLIDSAVPLAGMNHFMLPQMANPSGRSPLLAGEASLAALLDSMLARGAAHHRLIAKAFGGGMIIGSHGDFGQSVGQCNADFTREWLARHDIPLVAADFLGPWSRKILLLPGNGKVFCRRTTNPPLASSVLPVAEACPALPGSIGILELLQ